MSVLHLGHLFLNVIASELQDHPYNQDRTLVMFTRVPQPQHPPGVQLNSLCRGLLCPPQDGNSIPGLCPQSIIQIVKAKSVSPVSASVPQDTEISCSLKPLI